jgi:hypothetical protein
LVVRLAGIKYCQLRLASWTHAAGGLLPFGSIGHQYGRIARTPGAKLSANRSPFRKVLVGACVLEGRRAIRIVGQKQKVTVMPTFAAGTEELFMN